jgi:hypothetical protein
MPSAGPCNGRDVPGGKVLVGLNQPGERDDGLPMLRDVGAEALADRLRGAGELVFGGKAILPGEDRAVDESEGEQWQGRHQAEAEEDVAATGARWRGCGGGIGGGIGHDRIRFGLVKIGTVTTGEPALLDQWASRRER